MTLSVCFIVRNEIDVIGRSLACARKFADEIIVVDTGSTDGTQEEVKKYTDKLYFTEWTDDFSAARNFAFEKATSDYVMWLDADDVVTDINCRKIRELVDGGGFDMAYLVYCSGFEGERPTFSYMRERIFLRSENYRFSGFVHEAVSPRGKTVRSDAEIHHRKVKAGDPFRNLNIYQRAIARGICLDDRAKFYYGRELMFNGLYREAAAVLEDFLSGGGWVENKIEASLNLCSVYEALGDKKRAMAALLKSFTFDSPRAEACCRLGGYFFEKKEYRPAIYWYTRATECRDGLESGAFVNANYSTYIPCIQLCVLYDRLGDYKTACAFNEEAGRFKPQDEIYLQNKRYFQNKLSKEVKDE